ncbi:hypothetical protein G3N59_01235 [Paraburkholderia sp. Ac-20340]|uniref:hypothetical protein n=1 Tax=Paraburkholderia sp. Ac-20340 TaxID=2703888 RepID=UPI00197D0D99|nr:hypothetical protein [Paraburkholderia sp. Ac-20340]MBN3851991.1 hypothetical protein [Paraburkholderia sp. Ac-20340]
MKNHFNVRLSDEDGNEARKTLTLRTSIENLRERCELIGKFIEDLTRSVAV